MKKRGTPALPLAIYLNFSPKSKRSQAFLITAVIFIAIVSAFITIHNFSKKTTFSTFPYIAEEIQIESEKVMDYALIKSDENSINDFTDDVSNYVKKENIDIYFITGEDPDMKCYYYDNAGKKDLSSDNCKTTNSEISATIKDTTYQFTEYPSGKHFYFIMIKEDRGEKYVYTNA